MLQDVEAGRKTEVDIFAGTVIELGRKYETATPSMMYFTGSSGLWNIKCDEQKTPGVVDLVIYDPEEKKAHHHNAKSKGQGIHAKY